MRLAYVMELVLAFAAGMALERAAGHWHQGSGEFATYPKLVQYGAYVIDFGDPFCTGVVLVEGLALWIEFVLRRRTPPVWGFGRLTWSLSFFVAILISFEGIVWNAGRLLFSTDKAISIGLILTDWRNWFVTDPGDLVGGSGETLCLVALLATSLAGGCLRDPVPDAREWAGRLFFGALVILHLIHQGLGWYWE